MASNVFAISMNCYTWGRFDVGQCIEPIRQSPIRLLELPAGQTRPGSLIPELMLDQPLGGRWQYSVPDLQALIAEAGLEVEALAVFGFFRDEQGAAILRRRVDFARALGATTIVLGCHDASEPASERPRYYELIREVADYAAPRGIRFALEIQAGMVQNAETALTTLDAIDRPNLGINFDTANLLYYNDDCDPAAELKAMAPRVVHVHLKDILRGASRAEHRFPPFGQGEVDFRTVFDVLHDAGFYGPFSFEVESYYYDETTDDIQDCQDDLMASIDHVRSIGEFAATVH
ncbi:MAG: sugar phosphate isomerase/epimerase family protein [Planctomycetota bacterium]